MCYNNPCTAETGAFCPVMIPRATLHGPLAQLGERKVRNLEVRGSIPLRSTMQKRIRFGVSSFASLKELGGSKTQIGTARCAVPATSPETGCYLSFCQGQKRKRSPLGFGEKRRFEHKVFFCASKSNAQRRHGDAVHNRSVTEAASPPEYPPKVHHERIIRTSFLSGMGSDYFCFSTLGAHFWQVRARLMQKCCQQHFFNAPERNGAPFICGVLDRRFAALNFHRFGFHIETSFVLSLGNRPVSGTAARSVFIIGFTRRLRKDAAASNLRCHFASDQLGPKRSCFSFRPTCRQFGDKFT